MRQVMEMPELAVILYGQQIGMLTQIPNGG
jgi:hypothetical protein